MKIQYLTNISDPILKTDKKYRKHIKSLLVSEIYSSKFLNSDNRSNDFDFLLSDNGNFTRLSKIAKRFSNTIKSLDDELDELEKNNKNIPQSFFKRREKLNQDIIKACSEEAKTNFNKITSNQLAINPTAIIGGEDTTIPVLQISGAFDNRLKAKIPALLPFQKKTLELYSRQYNGEFGEREKLKEVKKYLVLHANDFNAMVKAIKNIGKTRHDAIAISLGGPLKRHGKLESVKLGSKLIKFKFDKSHPSSYILSIALLLALRDNVSKNTPIHILGLGTPILILLTGYVFRDFKFITIDSTSTYTDDLRDDKIFGISKMNLFKLVAYCILNKEPYKGKSPYFKVFEDKYKSNWNRLFTIFKEEISKGKLDSEIDFKRRIDALADTLEKNRNLLKDNLPFFTPLKSANKNMLKDLTIARAFENYWANNSICNDLSSCKSKREIDNYVIRQIEKYKDFAEDNYIKAVDECKAIIDKFNK